MPDKTYLGTGQLIIDGRRIENPTSIALNITEEKISLDNLGTPGGGDYRATNRIDAVTLNAAVHDYSAAMMASILKGTAAAYAGGAVASESVTAPAPGLFVPTAHMIDITQAAVKLAETLVDLKRNAGLGKSQKSTYKSIPAKLRDRMRAAANCVEKGDE